MAREPFDPPIDPNANHTHILIHTKTERAVGEGMVMESIDHETQTHKTSKQTTHHQRQSQTQKDKQEKEKNNQSRKKEVGDGRRLMQSQCSWQSRGQVGL